MIRKFHNRRAVFAATSSNGIQIANLTLRSLGEKPAQAEALLMLGEQAIVNNVTIDGSGDALQTTGSIYLIDSEVKGYGDNVLGSGAAFFQNCEMVSTFGPHVWVRNSSENRGNVFVNCKFRTIGDVETTIARAPTNRGIDYPFAEVVLINCALEGLRPEGWGAVGKDTSNIHYWEYNSTNLADGKPADVSRRAAYSRQLTMEKDAEIIRNYSNPAFVLKGWNPEMSPFIMAQPTAVKAKNGQSVGFEAKAGAIPEAVYQWFKDGKALKGETNSKLTINNVSKKSSGKYTVVVKNSIGSVTSRPASLTVE